MRAREGRRVVHAVTGHGDRSPGGDQAADDLALAFGKHLGLELVDAERPSDGLCGGAGVAGEHDEAHTVRAQRRERLGCRGLHRIRDAEHARRPPVDRDQHDRLALPAERIRL